VKIGMDNWIEEQKKDGAAPNVVVLWTGMLTNALSMVLQQLHNGFNKGR